MYKTFCSYIACSTLRKVLSQSIVLKCFMGPTRLHDLWTITNYYQRYYYNEKKVCYQSLVILGYIQDRNNNNNHHELKEDKRRF